MASLWSGRRGSCLVRSHLTAIPHFVLQQFHCFQTKVFQPQLAHATRSVARSSPLTQANKKEPFQDSFLLATNLPKLELHQIIYNLKNLLSQAVIDQLRFFKAA